MSDSPELVYSRQAAEALDKIEADPTSTELWNAVCDTLDLIADHPDRAEARREALRTIVGTTVWKVNIRVPRETEDWLILWTYDDDGGRLLIAYIGTL